MNKQKIAVMAGVVCLQAAALATTAAAGEEGRLVIREAPVLNSPWSGIPSFGAVASPSVLAAVSPPLIGGFLGPGPGSSAAAVQEGDSRRARLDAGLNAMMARNQVNVPGALGGPGGSLIGALR